MAKQGFKHWFFTNVSPVVIGVGASIVIIGALFKLEHWPGASIFLILGLGTEALIFFMSAFQPVPKEYEWEKVFKELEDDDDEEEEEESSAAPAKKEEPSKINEIVEAFNKGLSPDSIKKLNNNFDTLNKSVADIKSFGDAGAASAEYAKNVKSASSKLQEMNESYGTAVNSLSAFSEVANDAKQYHEQVQAITKNLGALNAVYEMELQDANSHLKALNKFYSNLSSAMENMSEASKDTHEFKTELHKLTGNLTTLNTVYGNMLGAMRGNS